MKCHNFISISPLFINHTIVLCMYERKTICSQVNYRKTCNRLAFFMRIFTASSTPPSNCSKKTQMKEINWIVSFVGRKNEEKMQSERYMTKKTI